ncbi:MAG: 30S ribosomal protein S6 [Mollicutes bacterium]|nr:30S ribosomal protein S6 [Mollicutes bacterium]
MMKKYEIMFIIKPTLGADEIKNVIANFEEILASNGGKIVESKELGQRELAYEIKKCKSGYYYIIIIEANNDKPIKEFDRLALINDNIIRHLITKIEM